MNPYEWYKQKKKREIEAERKRYEESLEWDKETEQIIAELKKRYPTIKFEDTAIFSRRDTEGYTIIGYDGVITFDSLAKTGE